MPVRTKHFQNKSWEESARDDDTKSVCEHASRQLGLGRTREDASADSGVRVVELGAGARRRAEGAVAPSWVVVGRLPGSQDLVPHLRPKIGRDCAG